MPRGRLVAVLSFATLLVAPIRASAQDGTDAYVNEAARELVRQARERLRTVDARIEQYTTTARERFSAGLRMGPVEKLVYRRETATRIDWSRSGPVRLDVLGMREVTPMFKAEPEVPFDISAELLSLAFDPANVGVLMRVDSTGIPHPLSAGSENHYRFEAGGTTEIRLPDGRTIVLRELRVIPRRRAPNLISGSLWLHAETHAIVQAYFKLARAFDVDRDGNGAAFGDREPDTTGTRRSITLGDIPFLRPIRAELDFIAIEYGLWEFNWWLPRLLAGQGVVQIGGVRLPLTYERTYEGYTVRGDTSAALSVRPDTLPRRCRERVRFATSSADAVRDSIRQSRTDSERNRRERYAEAYRAERGDTTSVADCEREYIITAPSDSVLLRSAELPATAYEAAVELISEAELKAIADRALALPDAPWKLQAPLFQWGPRAPIRYNRVEGLSLAARTFFDLGPATLEAQARIGLADLEPRGELAFDRGGDVLQTRLAAYRRLQPTTTTTTVPGGLASLGALLFGRDDVQYFDALGGELTVRPPGARTQWYDLRFYAERQRAVQRNTHFSVAHLINSNNRFHENFTADAADQIGARLRLRAAAGTNPAAPRVAGELSLGAETGDYQIFRPEALLRISTPLPWGWALGIEAGAGTVEGSDIPTQALWRLGGAPTLRGYTSNALEGERYWRTRADLGIGIQARPCYAVLGRSLDRSAQLPSDSSGALLSTGAGLSLFDGFVRLDLARALRAPKGWRLHLYLNGVL